MSKKDKSKFKKIIKAQIAQEMAKAQVAGKKQEKNAKIASQNVESTAMSIKTQKTILASPAATTTISVEGLNLGQIKYDLKKTGVVIAVLTAIIGLLYYFDLKYVTLLTFGNWLFRVFHIQ